MATPYLLPIEATATGSGRVGYFMYDVQAFGLVLSLIDEKRWLGTSFAFIRPERFVTAKHVVIENGAPRRDLAIQVLGNKTLVIAIYPHPVVTSRSSF